MGRALRIDIGNEIYHVLNRANARMAIFEKENDFLTENELEHIRVSISKSRPYGNDNWIDKIVQRFGLEITLRRQGRPRKGS